MNLAAATMATNTTVKPRFHGDDSCHNREICFMYVGVVNRVKTEFSPFAGLIKDCSVKHRLDFNSLV